MNFSFRRHKEVKVEFTLKWLHENHKLTFITTVVNILSKKRATQSGVCRAWREFVEPDTFKSHFMNYEYRCISKEAVKQSP